MVFRAPAAGGDTDSIVRAGCAAPRREQVSTSLKTAKSGIKFNPKYAEIGMKSQVCGRPEIDMDGMIDRKQARFMGENAMYAFIAMQKCIDDSGLKRGASGRGRKSPAASAT